MLVLKTQEPPLDLDACRACNTVWFDGPTYEALPQLAFENINSIALQATEIIAMERLKELKQRECEEREQARKKKRLHRISEPGKNPSKPVDQFRPRHEH